MMRRKRTNEYRAGPGPDVLPVFDTKALEALVAEWVTATIVLYDNQRPDGSDPWDSTGVAGETPDHAHTNISWTVNPNLSSETGASSNWLDGSRKQNQSFREALVYPTTWWSTPLVLLQTLRYPGETDTSRQSTSPRQTLCHGTS